MADSRPGYDEARKAITGLHPGDCQNLCAQALDAAYPIIEHAVRVDEFARSIPRMDLATADERRRIVEALRKWSASLQPGDPDKGGMAAAALWIEWAERNPTLAMPQTDQTANPEQH